MREGGRRRDRLKENFLGLDYVNPVYHSHTNILVEMSLSSVLTGKAYLHCPWCLQKCLCWGGRLANHLWQSIPCQIKLQQAGSCCQWSDSEQQDSACPQGELDPGNGHSTDPMQPSYNNYELLCGTTQAGDAEPNEPGTHFDTSNNSMCGFSPPPTDPHAPQGPLEAGNRTDMPNSDLSQNLALQQWSLLYANLTEDVDPSAGKTLPGRAETLWDQLSRDEDQGRPYAPFESKQEWELSYWLTTEGISQGAIDCFQKLQWVCLDHRSQVVCCTVLI